MKVRMRRILKDSWKKCGGISPAPAVMLAFVFSLLIAFGVTSMTADAYVNTYGVVKEGNGANIRLEPSTTSAALASVKGGERVEICGTDVGEDGYTWYKVYVNGNTIGYIRSDLVTDTGEKTGSIADDNLTGGTIGGQTGGGETPSEGTDPPQQGEGDGEGDEGGEGTVPPEEDGQTPIDPPPVTPSLSSNATLYALSISNGTLTPAFSPDVTQYTITLDDKTTSISAFGMPTESTSVVSENYGFSNLQLGSNMAVITVQAADGTRLSYLFTINRGEASEEMHYAVPGPVGSTSGGTSDSAQSEKGGSNIGWIIFLLILVVALTVVLVLMGLRLKDYRRDLYGGREQEFHLRDILPKGSAFGKSRGRREYRTKRSRRDEYEEEDEDDVGDEEEEEDEPYTDEDDYGYSVSDSIEVDPLSTASLADVDAYGSDDQYGAGEDMDEEALEDITERDSTINERKSNQDVWKSVNFMTPSDDLEFEFLDLDDNE